MLKSTRSGAELAAALAQLEATQLTDVRLRDAAREFEALTGWAQAGQLGVLAEIARRESAGGSDCHFGPIQEHDPYRFVADEIAVELTLSKVAASARVHLSMDLTTFPSTLKALRDGWLNLPKVSEIVDQLSPMDSPAVAGTLETAAIGYGRTHTRPQLRQWLRRRVIAFEPAAAEARRETAVAGRKVLHYPGLDGMGSIVAELPAHDSLAVWRMVDQVAQLSCLTSDHLDGTPSRDGSPGEEADGRSIDQRRADAFVDLILGRVAGARVTDVQVTVSAETLAGVSEEPAELAGFGAITAEYARRLASSDATWRRLLTDPATGYLVELGQHSYRPGDVLTRTEASNLAVLCRSHHLLKTHGSWHVEQLSGAILKWTTPAGRTFCTGPADHRPTRCRPGGVSSGDPPLAA